MKLTIESTSKTVELNGVPARVWEGHTDSGVPVHCYVTRVAVEHGERMAEFEAELQHHRPPSATVAAIPNRLLL